MSEASIRVIDYCASFCRNPQHNQNAAHRITKDVRRSLLVDSRRQAEKVAEEIGSCLELLMGNPDLIGAYAVPKRWYRHASVRAPNPSWADIANVTGDYSVMY